MNKEIVKSVENFLKSTDTLIDELMKTGEIDPVTMWAIKSEFGKNKTLKYLSQQFISMLIDFIFLIASEQLGRNKSKESE